MENVAGAASSGGGGEMALEEVSAMIEFAPVGLVVLDGNRRLKRVNKIAAETLGVDGMHCYGSPFHQWVAEEHWTSVAKALKQAADSRWGSGGGTWGRPSGHGVRVTLLPRATADDKPGRPFAASLACSACFTGSKTTKQPDGGTQDVSYILSITLLANEPTKTQDPLALDAPSHAAMDPYLSMTAALRDGLCDSIGYPLMALSSDGRTHISNTAAHELLTRVVSMKSAVPGEEDSSSLPHNGGGSSETKVDVAWLFDQFYCCEPITEKPMPHEDYPIYRAAVRGETFRNCRLVARARSRAHETGIGRLITLDGFPMLNSKGELAGGVCFLKDLGPAPKPGELGCETTYAMTAPTMDGKMSAKLEQGKGLAAVPKEDVFRWKQAWVQNMAAIAFAADCEGNVIYYNDRWYEYTGASKNSPVTQGWHRAHPEDMVVGMQRWAAGLQHSEPFEFDCRIRSAEGPYRWFRVQVHPVRDEQDQPVEWVGLLTDIHEMTTAITASREAGEHLSDAIRIADVNLWSVDTSACFTWAEGALATSRASAQDDLSSCATTPPPTSVVGRSVFEEWGPSHEAPVQLALAGETVSEEAVIRGRTYRTQYRPRRAKMTPSISFIPASEPSQQLGRIIGVTGLSVDITERVRMEQQAAQQAKDIATAELASQAAEEASRMKSQFLAVISHEIRTPLAGVLGLSELLLDLSLPKEAESLVHSIIRSSGNLLTVINDVLDFSKVEAGKLDLDCQPFSLRTVCHDSMWTYERLLASKGLELVVDVDIPEEILLGDAGRVSQVLANLIGNSGKFTETGSVSFTAKKRPRSIKGDEPVAAGKVKGGGLAAKDDANAEISDYCFTIRDTGCGIPLAQQKMLFQPFQQADPSTSRRYGGSGLGLSICSRLLGLMGGTISLESEEGKGTTIQFTLPLRPAPAKATESVAPDSPSPQLLPSSSLLMAATKMQGGKVGSAAPRPPLTSRTSVGDEGGRRVFFPPESPGAETKESKGLILLAEDNPINAQVASKTLQRLGYDVDLAENGEEVLALFDAQDAQPADAPRYDLVLMDCMMPRMDGYQATKILRGSTSTTQRKTIPIIALTAAVIGGEEICRKAGMTAFLSKPFKRDSLKEMLNEWVGKTHIARDEEEEEGDGAAERERR